MNIFDSETIINTPRALEIINNLTDEERKKLKKDTIKFILYVVIGFLLITGLFVLFLRSLNVSGFVKWFFAAGFLLSGYIASKFITHIIISKQRNFLETSQYARKNRIILSEEI